jgi:hypothetical protein
MIALFITAVVIGAAVSGLTGIGVLFWIAAGVVFACGLPLALLLSLVHEEVSYAQDCADYREAAAEMAAAELACEREAAEDERAGRLEDAVKRNRSVYNGSRQVHIHGA